MARTPTVYRWDDAGAPDINALMPNNNEKYKMWMYHILKACLVDGYGSKAAAGWTMPLEEITPTGCRFTLENAANTGVLLYEGGSFSGGSSSLQTNTLWVCESVPSMDAPVNAWSAGVRYADRETTNLNLTRVLGKMNVWSTWVVVANENSVLMFMGDASGTDFNVDNGSAPSAWVSTRLQFGVAHDSMGLGGVKTPIHGNFFLSGGLVKAGYSSYATSGSSSAASVTCCMGIDGLPKSDPHVFAMLGFDAKTTYAPLNALLLLPFSFSQYGLSGPDGSSSSYQYHAYSIAGLRLPWLKPVNHGYLNGWLKSRGGTYGVPFVLEGREILVVKSAQYIAEMVSLDPLEWGA